MKKKKSKSKKEGSGSDQGPLLDLHGSRTDEAIEKLDRFLVQLNSSSATRARVMTGKGTGAVQKTVIEYLKRGGYPFSFERLSNGQTNEGVLVLFLD